MDAVAVVCVVAFASPPVDTVTYTPPEMPPPPPPGSLVRSTEWGWTGVVMPYYPGLARPHQVPVRWHNGLTIGVYPVWLEVLREGPAPRG